MFNFSDSNLTSHVSELGGGQLDSSPSCELMSIFDAFLQLAAQQLTVDVQESHTSSHPDIWLDEHTLTLLNNPATELSIFEDAERKRILRRASSYVDRGVFVP
jgi:hypothetical protein